MKELDFLPTEYKPDASTRNKKEGRYLMPHPLIKKLFFEMTVEITEEHEKVSVKLIRLVSANKSIFRNVTRYATFEDTESIRECFWYPGEEVIQYQRVDFEEIAQGNYYSHLYHLTPKS